MLTVGEPSKDRRWLARPLALQVVAGRLRGMITVFDTFSADPEGWEFTLRVVSPVRNGVEVEHLAGALWDSAMRPSAGVVDVHVELIEQQRASRSRCEVMLCDARSSEEGLDARFRVASLPLADATVRLTLRWGDDVATGADVLGEELVAAAAESVRLWD